MDGSIPTHRLEAAKLYAGMGWKCIPIPNRKKAPVLRAWQDLRLEGPELKAAFADLLGNIGVLLGEASGGLVDVDLDDEVARQIADRFLPRTGIVFGRESRPRSHWFYRVATPPKSLKIQGASNQSVVEIRSSRQQTVVPPSVHPSGEMVRFDEFGEPTLIDAALLEARVRLLAVCAILARHWPAGSRHDAALAVAGWLLKEGVQVEDVRLIIGTAARLAGDEELDDRVRTVESTASRLVSGGEVFGASGLEASFGKKVAETLLKALGRSRHRRPEALNTAKAATAPASGATYEERAAGLFLLRESERGSERILLTSFRCRITREIVIVALDGTKRLYDVEVGIGELPSRRIRVDAVEFAQMKWVARELGASAFVAPRRSAEAAVAIQTLSQPVPTATEAATLGWHQANEQWSYVHAAGAIGDKGLSEVIHADLGLVDGMFALPLPPEGPELAAAARASIRLLDLAPDPVAVPLFAAVWRALIGVEVDSYLWLFGRTGVFKSELAALVQQHIGASMSRLSLPAAWSSTDNALEELAHLARHAVLVVDDFKPTGLRAADSMLMAKAERLLRGAGNHAGRSRLSRDLALNHGHAPQALVLGTGEDLPPGTSLQARGLMLHLQTGDVSQAALSLCQDDAKAGLFAQAASGFCRWLAARLTEEHAQFRSRVVALRSEFQSRSHPRLAGTLAGLHAALEVWGRFALDPAIGPLFSPEEVDQVLARASSAWRFHLGEAERESAKADPVERYIELLGEVFTTQQAHVSSPAGGPPLDAPGGPAAWGWRRRSHATGDAWEPRGRFIGWATADHLDLLPGPSWTAIQNQAAGGERFVESQRVVRAELHRLGLLIAAGHAKGDGFLSRTRVEGRQLRVLRLDLGVLASRCFDKQDGRDPDQPVTPVSLVTDCEVQVPAWHETQGRQRAERNGVATERVPD